MSIMRAVLAAVSVVSLAGCGGGGGVSGGTTGAVTPVAQNPLLNPRPTTPTTPSGNPSIVNPATDGPTVAQRFASGARVDSEMLGNAMTRSNCTACTNSIGGGVSDVAITPDSLGGMDVFMLQPNGSRYSPSVQGTLTMADIDPNSPNSWQRSWTSYGNQYSLSLWNAGRGGRAGLTTNQEGQTFHKIIGYYASDSGQYGFRTRGHAIIGDGTAKDRVEARTRQAVYDGYYVVNNMRRDQTDLGSPVAVRGGVRMTADFDNDTISGRSTSFEMDQGGGHYAPMNNTITFQTAEIRDYQSQLGNPGVGFGYEGNISSTFAPLNGGEYRGRFYGGNAQETAGSISAMQSNTISEGFFTAVEQP